MKLIPNLAHFKQCKVVTHFLKRCTGGKKIVRQKEICRLCCILPDQSKTVFPAKLQKLGVGVILTFLATLYILCFFDYYLSYFLLFNPPHPHLFAQLTFTIFPITRCLQSAKVELFGGGAVPPPSCMSMNSFIVSTNNFEKQEKKV
jgi:hypothetical protein